MKNISIREIPVLLLIITIYSLDMNVKGMKLR